MLLPKLRRLLVGLSVLSGVFATGQPAETSAPVHRVDGSYVREWLVLGPFPSPEMETDFLADAGGEANVRPKEGDAVTRKDGTMLRWTRFRSQRDRVNLERHFGIQPWSMAYAYCELYSDQPVEAGLRAVSHWSQSLWLDGAKVRGIPVHADHPETTLFPAFPVRLNAGNNACLLKLGRASN